MAYRKKHIHKLNQEEGNIEGHAKLESYITNYYKGFIWRLEEGNFAIDELEWLIAVALDQGSQCRPLGPLHEGKR
jgi:hypothetical protein